MLSAHLCYTVFKAGRVEILPLEKLSVPAFHVRTIEDMLIVFKLRSQQGSYE